MNAYVTLRWDITCSGEKTCLSNTMVLHSFMSLQVPNLLLLVISSTPTLMSPSVYWTRKSSKTHLCLCQTYPLLNLRAAKNKSEASLKIKWMSPFSFSSGRRCWQVVANDAGKTTSWAFHDPKFRMGGNVESWSIWQMELQWNWVVKDDARTANISYLHTGDQWLKKIPIEHLLPEKICTFFTVFDNIRIGTCSTWVCGRAWPQATTIASATSERDSLPSWFES